MLRRMRWVILLIALDVLIMTAAWFSDQGVPPTPKAAREPAPPTAPMQPPIRGAPSPLEAPPIAPSSPDLAPTPPAPEAAPLPQAPPAIKVAPPATEAPPALPKGEPQGHDVLVAPRRHPRPGPKPAPKHEMLRQAEPTRSQPPTPSRRPSPAHKNFVLPPMLRPTVLGPASAPTAALTPKSP